MTSQTKSMLAWEIFRETVLNDSSIPKKFLKLAKDKDDAFWIHLYESTFLKDESEGLRYLYDDAQAYYKEKLFNLGENITFKPYKYGGIECVFDYQGIPFSFCNFGNLVHERGDRLAVLKDRIDHSHMHFTLSLERHFDHIKKVYEFISTKFEDVVCMMGGGSQIQAFFKTEKGYIAILYLSLDYGEFEPHEYSLSVQSAANDNAFIDDFSVNGVKLVTHREVFGKC